MTTIRKNNNNIIWSVFTITSYSSMMTSILLLIICLSILFNTNKTTAKPYNSPSFFNGSDCHRRVTSSSFHSALFVSCPPPRFDRFLDSIIGSWSFANDNVIDGTVSIKTSSVDEVMRSCGGAVQGIKEIEYTDTSVDKIYHNRADDGFLYYNCGSYSSGPIQIDIGSSADELFLCSFSFPKKGKSRCLVSSSNLSVILKKGSCTDEMDILSQANGMILDQKPNNIIWEQEMLCRMSSPSQPWMLQRAKWFQNNEHDYNKSKHIDEDVIEKKITTAKSWISTYDIDQDVSSIRQSKELDPILSSNQVSKVIEIGVTLDYNYAKAFLRCYDDKGKLKAVLLQDGKVYQ